MKQVFMFGWQKAELDLFLGIKVNILSNAIQDKDKIFSLPEVSHLNHFHQPVVFLSILR